jgi:hypothetical protein
MDKVPSAIFNSKFNQLEYEVELYLDNGVDKFPINSNAIISLEIEESLSNWIIQGTLSFLYDPESGSNTFSKITGQRADATTNVNDTVNKPFYVFRNDGSDLLRIRMIPKLQSKDNAALNTDLPTDIDKVMWTLSYLFSVYDVEDVDRLPGASGSASATMKGLKLYFWDSWFQKMSTNTIEYSTGLSPAAPPQSDSGSAFYNPGCIPTGTAIKEIFEQSLRDIIKLNSNSNNIPPNPNEWKTPYINYNPVGTGDEWDQGGGNIFFTAPADTTAAECVDYVLNYHVSGALDSGGTDTTPRDFCILNKERGPSELDVGYLSLKPLASYYDKAGKTADAPGEYQYEHFYIQTYSDSNKRPGAKKHRGPTAVGNSNKVDMKLMKYNMITNYRFVDISALTNSQNFCTSPVYSFNFKNRQYKVEFENNSVTTARAFMDNNYINNLYTEGGQGRAAEGLFLITLNQDKQSKDIKPVYSLYGDNAVLRQADGLQKLLHTGIFQNACVHFRTLGLPFREPGRFISIDKTEGVESSAYADKFYGQWFVIDIKHSFEPGVYYNDITAVKINRFRPLDPIFPNTL